MQTKTDSELLELTQTLHKDLAQCLAHCASPHYNERASLLLEYLASHQAEMDKLVVAFEWQTQPKAVSTLVDDYALRHPITANLLWDDNNTIKDTTEINTEVFSFQDLIIDIYRTLLSTAIIPQAAELMQALLDMEEHETKK